MMLPICDLRGVGLGTVAMVLLALAGLVRGQEMQPFTTDGCSAFPNGTAEQQSLWLSCCVEHDKAYWLGGTYSERMAADEKLRQCVADVGEPAVAGLMLVGVRLGGSPFWPAPYRWGYGWPYPRGYKALTEEELAEAQRLLDAGM